MQIAQELSGYSLGSADLLRRAMGKKIKEEMDAQRKTFVEGATARGVDEAKASEIFDQVNKFAGYGFNKSHAAAYALVAYQTAWLKANHPVEFLAASMTYEMANTDKLNVFRQELGRLEVKLLPPDLNRSRQDFTVEKGAVRYALAALKNVGEAAMRGLVEERDRGGPFKDVFDFARRLDTKTINRRNLENLVRAGALDGMNNNRAQTFGAIELLLRTAASAAEERGSAQVNLFGAAAQPKPALPAVADWPPAEKLTHEFDAIGFYLSAHPMDAYGTSLKRLNVLRAAELPGHLRAGGPGRVKMAGALLGKQERTSSRGSRYAFLQLSDATGLFEVTAFSEVLAVGRDMLEAGGPLLLTVDARLEDDQLRLTCQAVDSLDKAAAKAAAGLRIYIQDEAPLPALKTAVGGDGPGRSKIVVISRIGDREVEIGLKQSYSLSARTISTLRTIPGIVEVQEM